MGRFLEDLNDLMALNGDKLMEEFRGIFQKKFP